MLRSLTMLAMLTAAAAGCGSPAGSSAPSTSPPNANAPAREGTESTRPKAAQILGWDDVQKLVAGQAGKVVVIDVWALTCEPCLREFPGLVKLSERYRGWAVCISFNIDFDGSTAHPPESYRADVEKFLNEQKADFLHVINNEPSEDFLNRIRLPGPPAVFVYGPTGELARRFDNSASKDAAFTYEKDVIPLVESLLADP